MNVPGDPREILIITVQYRNFADTAAFVESVNATHEVNAIDMIVVDNGVNPDSGQLESLATSTQFPIHVLRPSKNLYYWGGAAYAIGVGKASGRTPRWTIICNNDVVIPDASFFRRLGALDANRYPIVAPMIISANTGQDQNPLLGRPPGALKRLKWRVHDLHYRIAASMLWTNTLVRRLRNGTAPASAAPESQGGEQRIYAPHGAFVILSSAFFERGGVLDTTLAMYAEELSLAATAERLELPVWHCPDLRVIHKPNSTTGALLSREKYNMERAARSHYYGLVAGGSDKKQV